MLGQGSTMTGFVRDRRFRRGATTVLPVLAVLAAYYLSAELGLLLVPIRGMVTPLWPPAGVALFSLLLLGPRGWPGILLGGFLVYAQLGASLPAALAIAVGNTLAPLTGYLLLRRAAFRTELDRTRDALALLFLGALVPTLVSASVGTAALMLDRALPAHQFWATWSSWWSGDAIGIMLVTPLLLVLRRARWPGGVPPRRWAEATALGIGTVLVTMTVTRLPFEWHLLFLAFPFLVWAAFRFQLAGVAPCTLAMSVIASAAAVHGTGPFAGGDLLVRVATLQAFNGVGLFTGLLLAAVITERNHADAQLQRATVTLADSVARLEQRRSTQRGQIIDTAQRAARADLHAPNEKPGDQR
jgi:integral membrane sensor domain MASE1